MRRCKLNISLALLSTLGLALACGDDGRDDSGIAGAETGGAVDDGTSGAMDDASGLDAGGDGDGDPNTGDGDPNTGDGDPSSGDGDGDSGGTGPGDGDGDPGSGDGDDPFCGDGVIDPGEECDDGADLGEGFDCLLDCTLNVCGDGIIGPDEGCDDGNNVSNDGCSADCTLENIGPDAIFCGNQLFACGDTIDNDLDGEIDLDDPECISPCDDDEASFKTSLPGQNNDCKSDCYFDSNSGSGDDGCDWNLKCDPLDPGAQIGCDYNPNFGMCDAGQSQSCVDFCEPLVPNGCDCFGCCEIEGEFLYLDGADCSMTSLDECQPCTPNPDCNNICEPEKCEVCFGEDPNNLPPECEEPGCPEGETPCLDDEECGEGWFCNTGCCQEVVNP